MVSIDLFSSIFEKHLILSILAYQLGNSFIDYGHHSMSKKYVPVLTLRIS
jgi:hypothetical protein